MEPIGTEEAVALQFPYVHHLNHLDTLIPAKVQRGLATLDLTFSCVDVTRNYIAIGTSVGIAYLFDRRNGEIQKLRCEGPKTNAVTCIRCLETVELMVAMGMSVGVVAIFQIPLHGTSPNNNSNQMEKYMLNGLHIRPTTYLEWSRNGMKLFSGDESGVVAQTDIDFSMHLCKSAILLKENHAIVQLVYEQRLLLISTRHRTVLWTNDNQVQQVGQKERKSLGNFGACFCTLPEKPNETVVLASRPALRLWKANVNGKVLETFIFKNNLLQANQILSICSQPYLTPPASIRPAEYQFGLLHNFMDHYILTFNSGTLYMLTVSEPTIVKRFDGLDTVLSMASNGDEMFVLCGPRNIIRISCSLDHTLVQQNLVREESFLPSLKFMPNAIKELECKLKETSTLMNSSIFGMIKPIMTQSTGTGYPAESEKQTGALDRRISVSSMQVQPKALTHLSGTVDHGENDLAKAGEKNTDGECPVPTTVEVLNNRHSWAPLSDSEDDSGLGIVFEQHVRKGHNGRKRNSTSLHIRQKINYADSSSTDSADPASTDEPSPNSSEIPETGSSDEDAKEAVAPGFDSSINQLTASSNSREEKEILLAQMLDLKELLPEELQKPKQDVNDAYINCGFQSTFDTRSLTMDFTQQDIVHEEPIQEHVEENANQSNARSTESSLEFDIYRTNFSNCSNEDDEDDIPSHSNSDCNSYLSYGPPSGSSNMNSMNSLGGRSLEPPLRLQALALNSQQTTCKILPGTDDSCQRSTSQSPQPSPNSKEEQNDKPEMKYNDFWVQHKPPGYIRSLAVCEHYIVCTDVKDNVYYSSFQGLGFEWHRTEYLANQICISPSGKRVWRIYRNSAYALIEPSDQGPFGENWVEVDINIKHISVTDSCIWYVTQDGGVFAQTNIDDDPAHHQSRQVPFTSKIAQVTCAELSAWALTVDNTLLCRLGITKNNPIGSEWTRISFEAGTGSILAVALGINSTVWIIDNAFNVWFKTGLKPDCAPKGTYDKWWQVQISDYIYQNVSTLQNITSTLIDSLNPEQLTSMLNRGIPCVASIDSRGAWIYNALNHQLFTNQSDILGRHWSRINITSKGSNPAKWKIMTASGAYRHHGGVFMWQPGSNIFCLTPTSLRGSYVKLPESCSKEGLSLQCLSASPESLWLLTKSGLIYIRKGITVTDAGGDEWENLDLTQIAHHKLVHISCGSNLVWACDSKGTILMRIGSLQAPSIHSLQPAWVVVDDTVTGTAMQQFTFVKVFVGPLDYTVWAIDSKNNVFVREGIFPELLIGLGWVPVSGIQATNLAISERAVYALTPSKRIYRRYNISRNNYIGDYWMELPGQAEQLSVSVDDKLWALNVRHQLMQHEEYVLVRTGKIGKEKHEEHPTCNLLYSTCSEEDWELVDP